MKMGYVSYDVDKIKEYVFSTYKPSYVQGASNAIKDALDVGDGYEGELIRELKESFPGIEVVFSCGGTGLLKFHGHSGDKICEFIEKRYSEIVKGGSITAVSIEHSSDPINVIIKLLHAKLRLRKESKDLKSKKSYLPGRFDKRCAICGKYKVESDDECEVCRFKKEIIKEKGWPTNTENIPYNKYTQPYIGFVYCDINNAGSYLLNVKDESELKEWSSTVFRMVKGIGDEIRNICIKDGEYHCVTPIIGGDDVVAIVPAEKLLRVIDIIHKRESKLRETFSSLSFSYAFLIAPYRTSIYHLFKRAEFLLREAKSIYYNKGIGGINYEWLREGIRYKEPAGMKIKPSIFPGSFDEFQECERIAQKLIDKKVPKSLINTLLGILESEENEEYKKINLLYYVWRNSKLEEIVREEIEEINLEQVYKFFVKKAGDKYKYLKFSDVVNIYKLKQLEE